MTHSELGRAVKKLHPGAYDQHDDMKVGRAMQKRYLDMYGHVTADKGMDSGTVPERPRTLEIQLEQLKQGKRRCVFCARGSKVRINPKDYKAQKHVTPAGTFYFKPKLISRKEIDSALKEHRLNEILGDVNQGYGAPPKQELKPPVSAVVSRTPEGETVQGALTDQEHTPETINAAQAITPQGGSISVEPPQKEIAHRISDVQTPEDAETPDTSPEAGALPTAKPKKTFGHGKRWPKFTPKV